MSGSGLPTRSNYVRFRSARPQRHCQRPSYASHRLAYTPEHSCCNPSNPDHGALHSDIEGLQVIEGHISPNSANSLSREEICTFLASYGHKGHVGGVKYTDLYEKAMEILATIPAHQDTARKVKRKRLTAGQPSARYAD